MKRQKLVNGRGLVITGVQGSGKSTLARKTAEVYGSFAVISVADFINPFGLGVVLHDTPKTIIVDEFIFNKNTMSKAKAFISSEYIMVDRMMKEPYKIKTPNSIFVLQEGVDIPKELEERRYTVVKV